MNIILVKVSPKKSGRKDLPPRLSDFEEMRDLQVNSGKKHR